MRVLWLSPGFPGEESDLNCLPPLQLLALALSAQGVDVQIVTLGYPFHGKPYQWHKIPVVSGFGWNRHWFRWLNWIRVLRHARTAHQRQKFDLIHSFWLGPSWLIGRYLQRRWNIPHVTTLMGQDVLEPNKYRRLLKARHEPGLVAVSAYQNDIFKKTTGFRAGHIIPWGVGETEIPNIYPELRPVDVLGCGALIPLKNWPLWIETLAEVVKNKPDLRAELIGSGPEKYMLEAQIKALGLEDRIRLSGHIPRPEVLARMQQSKVFFHTAHFESFGMVLAEAAMQGCRLVGTPAGILPDLGPTGDTAQSLAIQICIALEQKGLTHLPTRLSIDHTAAAYFDLYQEEISDLKTLKAGA